MSSPSQAHQTILTELLVSLRGYIKEKSGNCSVFPSPFDVKLNDDPLTIVQPDLMVVCDKNKLDGKRCNGAPDFIIEIVSPTNPSDDYIRKLCIQGKIVYIRTGKKRLVNMDKLRSYLNSGEASR